MLDENHSALNSYYNYNLCGNEHSKDNYNVTVSFINVDERLVYGDIYCASDYYYHVYGI